MSIATEIILIKTKRNIILKVFSQFVLIIPKNCLMNRHNRFIRINYIKRDSQYTLTVFGNFEILKKLYIYLINYHQLLHI